MSVFLPDAVTVGGEVPDIVIRYLTAANNENWDELRELWHPEGELTLAGMPLVRGRDHIMAHYLKVLGRFPKHVDVITRAIVAANTIVLEIRFDGTNKAGAPIAFDAVDVIDLEDDRIRRLQGWFDTHEVLRLTGVR